MICQVSHENSDAGSTVSHFSDWSCIWNFKKRISFLISIYKAQCYSRNFVLRWAEYHASPVKVILSAFSQLWPSNYIFAHLRTESVKECKKSEWKVKEIRGIFGKLQMATSVRILRISASNSTQRLFRMSDWRISGLILKNW